MIEINYIGLTISMVLMLAFITPIILNVRKNNKVRKALLDLLSETAQEKGLKIQKMDTWRNRYAIALDGESGQLIYINNFQVVYIDLNKMDLVDIHEKHHLSGSGKESYKVIDNLDLNIHSYGDNSHRLCFYDGDTFSDVQNEKPLLEDWYATIEVIIQRKADRKKPVLV